MTWLSAAYTWSMLMALARSAHEGLVGEPMDPVRKRLGGLENGFERGEPQKRQLGAGAMEQMRDVVGQL
ncbi:hypothetical protein [Sorangium sp. So ce388]|uniref:hypothetical protein n=1 Tax=Sorangium sp. So ce388 TaxID=3133309 RepID=UPI003F5C707E